MGDERRLLGRLGQHGIAGGQRGAIWPVKIASGKFQGLMQVKVPTGSPLGGVGGVVAQEIHRLAQLGHRIGTDLPASRAITAKSSPKFSS